MIEIVTAFGSSLLLAIASRCSRIADETARDDEAWKEWHGVVEEWCHRDADAPIKLHENPFTRYHTGEPWDRWHIIRRIERYLPVPTAVGAVLIVGGWSWWFLAWIPATIIGWHTGSKKWTGSVWTFWKR